MALIETRNDAGYPQELMARAGKEMYQAFGLLRWPG
jgi:hypothetical protein